MRSNEMASYKGCGAEIFWIKTQYGKSMPVDEKLVPYYKGSDVKIVTEDGRVISGSLEGPEDAFQGFGYISHFATCPKADKFRRRKS